MEKQKALELIKQVIDQSVKGGLMPNVDTAVAVAEAFQTIVNEIQKPNFTKELKQDLKELSNDLNSMIKKDEIL